MRYSHKTKGRELSTWKREVKGQAKILGTLSLKRGKRIKREGKKMSQKVWERKVKCDGIKEWGANQFVGKLETCRGLGSWGIGEGGKGYWVTHYGVVM